MMVMAVAMMIFCIFMVPCSRNLGCTSGRLVLLKCVRVAVMTIVQGRELHISAAEE